ncbi:hypothetical protein U3516DRAFT_739462 [Neocallimastix sp. 'constans']
MLIVIKNINDNGLIQQLVRNIIMRLAQQLTLAYSYNLIANTNVNSQFTNLLYKLIPSSRLPLVGNVNDNVRNADEACFIQRNNNDIVSVVKLNNINNNIEYMTFNNFKCNKGLIFQQFSSQLAGYNGSFYLHFQLRFSTFK